MARKQYLGGVAATTLAGNINSAVTSLSVASGGGADFPTAASFPFVIVIGRNTASEEVMLCTARATDTLTVTRAYDSTTAASHVDGDTVEHCIDATIVDALSVLLHTLTTAGDLPYATADATWARLAKGTAYQGLAMNSGATAPEWVATLQSLLTTQGDLPYASSANTPTRLAKGTAGQILTMNSGATAPEWGTASPTASGSYTGDATTDRTVTLAFTPKYVVIRSNQNYIFHSDVQSSVSQLGYRISTTTIGVQTTNATRPALTTLGFIVSGSAAEETNHSGSTFYYMAVG